MVPREQLELVVQKKKIEEVHRWFRDHFIDCTRSQYVRKCPFLVIQGPTGCGKTSTLQHVAAQLGVPITEFCGSVETKDLKQTFSDHNNSENPKDANKFIEFVAQKLWLVPIPLNSEPIAPSADSEFDISSDEEPPRIMKSQPKPVDKPSGIIIHVQASLSFARSQKILVATMKKIIDLLKRAAKNSPRRGAIVFENIECEQEMISIPNKFKQAIGLEMIKFNPIIGKNMKNFIHLKLKSYPHIALDENTIETLISDCDGDLSACLNSLKLIGNHASAVVEMDCDISTPISNYQMNKRQRMNPGRPMISASLMRDVTRSCGFFHLLGKIFYQKRLYPEKPEAKRYRPIERPYALENTTEYLTGRLSIDPKTLLAWLHQHYYNFCGSSNIDKASLFLDHLSDADSISINSIQSTQFYEMHHIVDQQQINLALELTTFSLYHDQSALMKARQQKVIRDRRTFVVKSSVEKTSAGGHGDLYAFKRPDCLSMHKVIEDRETLLKHLTENLLAKQLGRIDGTKLLVDYLPYLNVMSQSLPSAPNMSQANSSGHLTDQSDNEAAKLIKLLTGLESASQQSVDFDAQHEQLMEVIERIEEAKSVRVDEGVTHTGQTEMERVLN